MTTTASAKATAADAAIPAAIMSKDT